MPSRICTGCALPIPMGTTRCPTCAPIERGTGWKRQQRNKRILERDGYICQLRIVCDGAAATVVDHVLPLARGGTNDETNLQAACQPCNANKGAPLA